MITIVTGLPRSGTSLMMQMLAAGGMPVLCDGERQPDEDNPRGYLEWERIKKLPTNPGLMAEAEGKVVKVITELLFSLPPDREYRVIFLQRPLPEVLASQEQMLQHRQTEYSEADRPTLLRAFQEHLYEAQTWLNTQPNLRVLRLRYPEIITDPRTAATRIAHFLECELNIDAMAGQVDPALYRQRAAR